MEPAERRKNQRANQDYFSEKISDLSRYIGFGLVAAAFSLLSKATEYSKNLSDDTDFLLVLSAICGCIVIVCDYVQMFFGWSSASLAARNFNFGYRMSLGSWVFRIIQIIMFFLKQFFAMSGAVIIIYAISKSINIASFI
ncbi:hypothetical protein [Aurantimonas marina]|uniref:hypothetical protein n=1 Tax=Aurantimonas marina TaxID=2780508 RepID=UPI0019D02F09|nr:hypothetical protein [Aurantimonas marina]